MDDLDNIIIVPSKGTKMPKKQRKVKAAQNEALAKDIVKKFTHSLTWRQPFKEKWDRFYKMYRSHLDEKAYPWMSNLWIPYSFSTIETVAPRMVANRPQIDIMPREEGDIEYAKIQEKLIDFQWEKMEMDELLPDVVKQALIYGTSILKVYWKREEREVSKKVLIDDNNPDLGIIEDLDNRVVYDGPEVELVDMYDFFWDPRGTTIEDCRWVAHRMYRTIEHLEELQKEGVYKNIKHLKGTTATFDDDEKSERYSTLGVSIPTEMEHMEADKNLVELIEYWDDENVVTVANRKYVIREEKNPYNHAMKPFVKVVDQSVPKEFLGIGELEPIETLQYELNDRRNQRMDNVTLTLNRMWKIKNGANVDENELVSDAGGVVHTDDMNGVDILAMPDVTASSYQEETLIKGDIQQTTGVSDFTRGVGSDALANDTATGISLIQEAGNARFRQKIRNLENALETLGSMIVDLNAQFIDEEKVLRISGDSGISWMEIKPEDMRSDFDVMVQSGSTLPSNEAVEKKQVMELYQIFAGDPEVNQTELKRRVLEAFGVKNLDKLLPPAQEVDQSGVPMGDQGLEQAPGVVPEGQLTQQGILQSALAPEKV
jgi:hypothetical protein